MVIDPFLSVGVAEVGETGIDCDREHRSLGNARIDLEHDVR
jgi:hypothetical protein